MSVAPVNLWSCLAGEGRAEAPAAACGVERSTHRPAARPGRGNTARFPSYKHGVPAHSPRGTNAGQRVRGSPYGPSSRLGSN